MELLSTLGLGAIVLVIILGGAAVWRMVRELVVSGKRNADESDEADDNQVDR